MKVLRVRDARFIGKGMTATLVKTTLDDFPVKGDEPPVIFKEITFYDVVTGFAISDGGDRFIVENLTGKVPWRFLHGEKASNGSVPDELDSLEYF